MSVRPGSARPLPTALPEVLLSRDHQRQVVAARRREELWERVCRGASVAAAQRLTPQGRALATVAAVHARLVTPHWFSHESAALIWGLPVWRVPQVTHVRQRIRPSGRHDRSVVRHGGVVDERRLTIVSGLPVTDLVQTMVDCARALPPLPGLVVADAALRAGADRSEALTLLGAAAGRRGTARARAVIELADAGAESAGETATRFVLLRDGLPRPETQVRVETRLGTFWSDLGWDEWRVLLEYDGRAKYTGIRELMAEKRRQDALLEVGYRVVRVTKEDIPRHAGLSTRVRRLLPPGTPVVRRPALCN